MPCLLYSKCMEQTISLSPTISCSDGCILKTNLRGKLIPVHKIFLIICNFCSQKFVSVKLLLPHKYYWILNCHKNMKKEIFLFLIYLLNSDIIYIWVEVFIVQFPNTFLTFKFSISFQIWNWNSWSFSRWWRQVTFLYEN